MPIPYDIPRKRFDIFALVGPKPLSKRFVTPDPQPFPNYCSGGLRVRSAGPAAKRKNRVTSR